MADTTTYKTDVSRAEASELLQELARELHTEGGANVTVGNKVVTLTPASVLEYEIKTEERSPMLGKQHEKLTLELSWTVETDDGES